MSFDSCVYEKIKNILVTQNLAVLATCDNGKPYTSLVAFTPTDNLHAIIIATNRNSKKFHNLTSQPNISLLIETRLNTKDDFSLALAVTGFGIASVPYGDIRRDLEDIHLQKHPGLKSFTGNADCAIIKIDITKYLLVENFQEVREYIIEE